MFFFLRTYIYCTVGLITNPTLRVCPRAGQNIYFEIQTIQAVYVVSRFERVHVDKHERYTPSTSKMGFAHDHTIRVFVINSTIFYLL